MLTMYVCYYFAKYLVEYCSHVHILIKQKILKYRIILTHFHTDCKPVEYFKFVLQVKINTK